MPYSFVFFFLGQLTFLPVFILTTKKLFVKEMGIREGIKFVLMSPLFVYIYATVLYLLVSAAVSNDNLYRVLSSYADILALFISFVFTYIYGKAVKLKKMQLPTFIYTTFYMVGMVFSLTYENKGLCIVFSLIMPAVAAFIVYRYIVVPLEALGETALNYTGRMLYLPLAAEMLLILRFFLTVFRIQNSQFDSFEPQITIYSTLFGYLIFAFLLVNTDLITANLKQQDALIKENTRIANLSLDVVMALVGTLDAKDEYTNGHSQRVAEYSNLIGAELGFDEKQLRSLYFTALLHDIGKIGTPDAIINKKGRLTPEEYSIVCRHPSTGADILRRINEIPDLYVGALCHHERWDGKGYPQGISGDEIPLTAQIISVADAYDAMTSMRSYRDVMSQEDVRKEIEEGAGTQFSPATAKAMLSIMSRDKSYELRQEPRGRS